MFLKSSENAYQKKAKEKLETAHVKMCKTHHKSTILQTGSGARPRGFRNAFVAMACGIAPLAVLVIGTLAKNVRFASVKLMFCEK